MTNLKRAALAACAVLLAVSSAAAAPFASVPDAGLNAHMKAKAQTPTPNLNCATNPTVTVSGAVFTGCMSAWSTSPVAVFEGIPYATQTRWQNSTLNTPATMTANAPGNICPQEGSNPTWPPMAEDCLNLNIWMPQGAVAGSLPVMVFIHGGAFVSGHGSSPMYDGSALAQQGVVVVSLNYRLGPFGFLVSDHKGIVAPGNMGLIDQQNALQWVQNYIAPFGGDKTRVTIFGESAGAMSVGLHLFSVPTSDTLFNAAIMESNPVGIFYNTKAAAKPAGSKFLYELCVNTNPAKICDQTWFQSTVTTQQILTEQAKFSSVQIGLNARGLLWAPVIDLASDPQPVVMNQPFDGYAAGSHAKPFVFGVNRDEGVLFAAGAAKGNGSAPSQGDYNNMLSLEYGSGNVSAIAGYPLYDISTGSYCYNKKYQHSPPNPFCYYSSWGQSLANVLTDYSFATGNLVMARESQGAFVPPVFAYVFTQKPEFDLYAIGVDHGACWPNQDHVCHGNELPYVFDTLATAPMYQGGPSDEALARIMSADWVAFAKNPLAPGADFTRYDFTLAPEATGYGNGAVAPNQPYFPDSNESFWNPMYPQIQMPKP
ncbi:MAG: carboxylesterase family protein [Rhizomicrobium sp.]